MMTTAMGALAHRVGVDLKRMRREDAAHTSVAPEPRSPGKAYRPQELTAMVGQERARTRIGRHLLAARQRTEQPGHVLIHGPAGLGKTSLAELIAHETGGALHRANGATIRGERALARLLAELEDTDVLLLDEIHSLPKTSAELLLTGLEDGRIEVQMGGSSGAKAQIVTIELAAFTLVGATTELGRLSLPMRSRFKLVVQVEYYSDDELAEIIVGKALSVGQNVTEDAALALGRRGRNTARTALNLFDICRDHAAAMGVEDIDVALVDDAMSVEDTDTLGLTTADQQVLRALCDPEGYHGGPVGEKNLACTSDVDVATLISVVEPFLIRRGMLIRMPRGRCATRAAFDHLGLRPPADLGWG